MQHGVRPAPEQVGVGGEVHDVDRAGARGPRSDLAEHHLAVTLQVPLHMGETVGELQRFEHRAAHRRTAREVRHGDVAQRHGHRADPFQLAGHQWARLVPADVLEDGLAAGADGVVRELLGVYELLDRHAGHAAQPRQHAFELGRG